MGGIDYIIPFNYFVPTIWEERLPRQTHIYLWADLPTFDGLTEENSDDFYGPPGPPGRHVRVLVTDTVWRAYRNKPENWEPEGWEPSAECSLYTTAHYRLGLFPPYEARSETESRRRFCDYERVVASHYQDITYDDGPFGLLEIGVPEAWRDNNMDLLEGRVDLFSDAPLEQLTTFVSCRRIDVVPNPGCSLFITHNGLVLDVSLDRDDLDQWESIRNGWFALLDGFAADARADPAVFESLIEEYLGYYGDS